MLQWTSYDPLVATVDANGLVTATGIGTTIIKATTTDGSNLSALCGIHVTAADGIGNVTIGDDEDAIYYTIDGIRLSGKPQQPGIYIRLKDGKSHKVVVQKK